MIFGSENINWGSVLYWFERIVCYSPSEGDVYKAQTPAKEAQEALEVKEDPEVKVEVPVDQVGSKGWHHFDSVMSALTSPIPTSASPPSSPWPLVGSVYIQLATYPSLEAPCQTVFGLFFPPQTLVLKEPWTTATCYCLCPGLSCEYHMVGVAVCFAQD